MSEPTLFPHWREAVRQLIEVEGMTYGTSIQKLRIAELCRLKPPRTVEEVRKYDLKMLGYIVEIRRELLETHKMLLASDNAGNYRIVMPQDQTRTVVSQGVADIQKSLRKMSTGLANTNTLLLTDEQRKQNVDAQAKLSMLSGMHRREKRGLLETAQVKEN